MKEVQFSRQKIFLVDMGSYYLLDLQGDIADIFKWRKNKSIKVYSQTVSLKERLKCIKMLRVLSLRDFR